MWELQEKIEQVVGQYFEDHDCIADTLEYYDALQEQQGEEDAAIRMPDNNGLS